jgi:hypothetical protein
LTAAEPILERVDETPYRIAYDLSVRAIDDQARVLEQVRARAGTLFAATALATSFLGGEALARARPDISPISFMGLAIACFIASSLLTLFILWPFRFGFSLSAREMLREVSARSSTAIDVYQELAIRIELNYDHNAGRIKALFWLLRGAILF